MQFPKKMVVYKRCGSHACTFGTDVAVKKLKISERQRRGQYNFQFHESSKMLLVTPVLAIV